MSPLTSRVASFPKSIPEEYRPTVWWAAQCGIATFALNNVYLAFAWLALLQRRLFANPALRPFYPLPAAAAVGGPETQPTLPPSS
jgi:hypothetical protein